MGIDKKPNEVPEFSFGIRELRLAQRAKAAVPGVGADAPKARDAGGGFDPYNSSGGFDRRKNWARVGKR